MKTPRGRAVALGAAVLVIGIQVSFFVLPAGAGNSSAPVSPPSFQASVSAYGFRVTETIPNGPLASTLLDGGGPTAQAGLDSIGGTSGYASFPDPGAFIAGLPNLGAGLLQLPVAPPQYPLVVNASQTKPHVEVALGVYDIKASAEPDAASANAQAGLSLGVNVALAKSTASIQVEPDGSVVATAEADIQGLGIGPLKIGEIKCVATKKIDAAGKITTSSDIRANALSIGGIAVPLPLTALNALGLGKLSASLPISINPVLEDLLAADGVKIKTITAQDTGSTIVAPALEIDGVIPGALKLGTGDGSYSIVLGQASATMIGSAALPPAPPTGGTVPPTGTTGGSGTQSGGSLGGVIPPIGSAPPPTVPSAPSSSSPPPVSSGGPGPVTTVPPQSLAASLKALSGAFGISGIYLMVALLAVAAFLVGQLFRVIGVKIPWTSTDG